MRLAIAVIFSLLFLATPVRSDVAVVTSIEPLALLIKDIGGEDVGVTSLVPNAGSIHHYSMRMSDRIKVERADLVVLVGAGLEPFLEKLSGLEPNKVVRVDRLDHVATLALAEDDDHDHGHTDVDPHLWLSPHNTGLLALKIAERLGQLIPAKADLFAERAVAFNTRQSSLLAGVNVSPETHYVAYHNAVAYLLAPLGIELRGVLTNVNESRLGMRSLFAIKREVQRAEDVCVLVQAQNRRMSEKILGQARYAVLDVMADQGDYGTYQEYLAAMLNAIENCH
jgi:zinc transport system substrate-binding protein